MIDRLGPRLASKPKRTAVIFICLLVALVLVTTGLIVSLIPAAEPPYPSDERLLVDLVDGKIVYTQNSTTIFAGMTPAESFPYSGMMIMSQVGTEFGYTRTSGVEFGNQTILSGTPLASVHQTLMTSSFVNASIDITDLTGDGSFDAGDTIVFSLTPLREDFIFTFGLLWRGMDPPGNSMAMEVSFALHKGMLYAWYSTYLDDSPWYEPYLCLSRA